MAFLTVWCAANPRLPRLLRIILFAIGSVSSGFVCYWAGGGLFGLVRSALPPIAIGPPDLGISWHWFFLGVVTASTLYVGIILSGLLNRVGAGNQIANTLPQNNRTKSCPALFTVFLAAIALLPVTTIWELMHPLPIPDEPHFSPNGIAELVRLGQKLDQSQITKLTSADVIDYDRVAKAVAAQQTDYDEISRVLQIPSWIPVTYDLSYFDNIGDLSARRQIARLLSAKCQVEIRAKRIDDAINTEAAMLNLAEIYYQGGFAVDFLVAVACEGIAQGADLPIHRSVRQKAMPYDAANRGVCGQSAPRD